MPELPFDDSRALEEPRAHTGEADFLWKTYRWMSLGLALTGVVAWLVANTPSLAQAVFGNRVVFYGVIIAEFVMVVAFASRASRMSFGAAVAVFTGYSALNGVTMAMIFLIFTAASVGQVFFVCAVAFASLSVYGATTKRDLTAVGQFMFIGLVGFVIASVVNLSSRALRSTGSPPTLASSSSRASRPMTTRSCDGCTLSKAKLGTWRCKARSPCTSTSSICSFCSCNCSASGSTPRAHPLPQTPHVERHFTGTATVRDIVIGMSDGLTVPFALAAGLSGAVESTNIVVTAGLAEIAAGSIAMGLGGTSPPAATPSTTAPSASARRPRSRRRPRSKRRRWRTVFRSYGLTAAEAKPLVDALRKRPEAWVDFMMRFELGLERPDPRRALRSAGTIAGAYVAGGLIPLGPYMLLPAGMALPASVGVTLIALAVFGYVKGHFTGAPLGAQFLPNRSDRRTGGGGGVPDRTRDLVSRRRPDPVGKCLHRLALSQALLGEAAPSRT